MSCYIIIYGCGSFSVGVKFSIHENVNLQKFLYIYEYSN